MEDQKIEEGKTESQIIRELVEENLRLTKEIKVYNAKIKKYMKVRTIVSIIWLILILAPIIAALIWLPPFIKDFVVEYKDILGGSQDTLNIFKL